MGDRSKWQAVGDVARPAEVFWNDVPDHGKLSDATVLELSRTVLIEDLRREVL
jgi:hypothetical protein